MQTGTKTISDPILMQRLIKNKYKDINEEKISLGIDSSTINKRDYFVYKDHYRCPHDKCTSVLSR